MSVLSGIAGSGSAETSLPRDLSRVAIVGCGAVAEKLHLPALAESDGRLRVTALVDVDESRTRALADAFEIGHTARDCSGLADHADIAVIAVPHHLHARLTIAAMEAGLHAFVEKPLAASMADARLMLDASRRLGRGLGVGLVRRHYTTSKFVQSVLESGLIGDVRSFDFREGGVYNWPLASDATFRKQTAGGVLFDQGAHTLDSLLSWLGDFRDVVFADDSRGGVDANCLLELALASGVTGVVEMSRTRNLRNTCIIRGEKGELEIGTSPRGPVTVRVGGTELTATPRLLREHREASLDDARGQLFEAARLQLQEFADAIAAGRDSAVFAERSLAHVRLFDACRARTRSMDLPWETFEAPFEFGQLEGKTILVLGGTGFVGGRLVEVLALRSKARVRVMARAFGKLAGVSRFEVEMVPGDICDRGALARALKGVDVVVNCTWGRGSLKESMPTNVDAVRLLVEETARAGCRRIVHLSTIVAYGIPSGDLLTEEATSRPSRSHPYSYTKWQGDEVALEAARRLGMDVRILLPTAIYGPGAPSWTVNPLRLLRSEIVPLVDGGNGVCNHIYVDDMVLAILCAATSPDGGGERYFASGPRPSSWREFYGAYEDMLGMTSTTSMSLRELVDARTRMERGLTNISQLKSLVRDDAVQRRLRTLPAVMAVKEHAPRELVERAKRVLRGPAPTQARRKEGKPVFIHAEFDALYQASRTVVSIAKAERLLGYHPVYDLERGMQRTAAWARWASLL